MTFNTSPLGSTTRKWRWPYSSLRISAAISTPSLFARGTRGAALAAQSILERYERADAAGERDEDRAEIEAALLQVAENPEEVEPIRADAEAALEVIWLLQSYESALGNS